MMRIVDGLRDVPARVMSPLGEALLLWRQHPVAGRHCGPVRLVHPQVGLLELHCQRLIDPNRAQQLVMYTAGPGSESQEKLQLLAVIGSPGPIEAAGRGYR